MPTRLILNNTSTPPSGVNAVHELPSPINMCKDVTIFGRKLNGSTDAAEVINRLENQRHVFENPARIITDKGSHLLPPRLKITVKSKNILHISITTDLPRSNDQIEKQNSTIISVLSKLSVDDPEKWYSHVPHLQEILNSTFQRSIKMTPFELLFGTKMKSCQDIEIVELLNDEITAQFQEQRDDALRQDAKSKSTKFKMRIAARTISDADKLININYMT
ncbi:transposon Ty3-I Gag-Pol polyprotein [Trichonephila clavipes]|nr:transposon Ty3-I Gag-Pol polyprotein [Trichonephila clavipes]